MKVKEALYTVGLGAELGKKLNGMAQRKHLTLSTLARQVLWDYVERQQVNIDAATIARIIKKED